VTTISGQKNAFSDVASDGTMELIFRRLLSSFDEQDSAAYLAVES